MCVTTVCAQCAMPPAMRSSDVAPVLLDFAPFGVHCIELGSVSELSRAVVLGDGPDAVLDVIARHFELLSARANTSNGNVNMWMLGIVVGDGNPFERCPEVLFHLAQGVFRETLEIETVPELWRQDDLPEQLVMRRLPRVQLRRDINSLLRPG